MEVKSKVAKDVVFACYCGLVGILATVFILWSTGLYGIGVSPDSVLYFQISENLLALDEFYVYDQPPSMVPPLYSLFLALASAFSEEMASAARVLNALIFGLNIVLVAVLVYVATEKSVVAAILASVFIITSMPIFEIHTMAWSEPLFIFISLSFILSILLYMKKSRLYFWLALFLLSLAMVTRYVGLAFFPTLVSVLFFVERSLSVLKKPVVWLGFLLAWLPLGGWIIAGMLFSDVNAPRGISVHFVAGWRAWVLGLLSFAFIIASVVVYRMYKLKDLTPYLKTTLAICLVLFTLSFFYLLALFFSISFFDFSTPVDARILSPVIVFAIVAGILVSYVLAKALRGFRVWKAAILCAVILLAYNAFHIVRLGRDIRMNGRGYTVQTWRESESVAYIRSLPGNMKIYSNGPDAIKYLASLNASLLPAKVSPYTLKPNAAYRQETQAICEDVKLGNALVVYFSEVKWRWYLVTLDQIESICEFPVAESFKDGVVYLRGR